MHRIKKEVTDERYMIIILDIDESQLNFHLLVQK